MGTLSARDLRDSLQKAKGVGLVEERFTIGDCEVVVRSLRPDEYEAILADCAGREGVGYLNCFQLGHVSRAIIELNGQDFRDIEFVDDEEPDPKKAGQTRAVKLELHKWLERNVLNTWGKEVIYTAYRKVADVVEKAEKQSKEGIQFLVADETPEERFRRTVGEMLEAREDVPQVIIEKVLDDNGLMLKTTAEEARQAMEAADRLAREQIAKEKAEQAAKEPPAPVVPPTPVEPPPIVQAPVEPPAAIMRNRQPLNTAPLEMQTRQVPNVVPASRQPASALPQDAVPTHAIQGPPVTGSAAVRAAQMAALEMDADQAGVLTPESLAPDPSLGRGPVPILEHRQPQGDPKAVASIIDQMPKVGLNPHFRSPRRA